MRGDIRCLEMQPHATTKAIMSGWKFKGAEAGRAGCSVHWFLFSALIQLVVSVGRPESPAEAVVGLGLIGA